MEDNFCNEVNRKYELEYPNIIKNISGVRTAIFCPDDGFIKNYGLSGVYTYEVSNDTLTFTYKNNTGTMTF